MLSCLNTTANTQLLIGIFPDDTAEQIIDKVSFIHIDVDTYISCKDTVEWLIPKLSIGGIIVFDDYGFLGLEGVTRYVNEFSKDPRFIYNYNLNGHATFVKIKE
jgi:O-methyltransferase